MKTLFHWGRNFLKRVELFTQEDLAKKPAIPTEGSKRKLWMKITDKKERKAPWIK